MSQEPLKLFQRNHSPASEGTLPWGTPSYSPSLTPHQEKRFSAQGRACSFPSWPEAPTGWGAEAPDPCGRTTVLGTGPEWASRRDSWGSWRPLPVTGQGCPLRPSWRHGERGRAQRGGPCTAMADLRTQTVGTVCVAEGSKHESKRPSGRSLQTNPGAVCIFIMRLCISILNGRLCRAWSGDANPGLVEDHRLSWVRWSKGCKTPASSWLEGPARLHPLSGGQQSPRARHEHSELPLKSRECRWTWEVAWRTESRSRVELCAWVNETGWAAQTMLPDATQVAPTVQSTYLRWCSEGE